MQQEWSARLLPPVELMTKLDEVNAKQDKILALLERRNTTGGTVKDPLKKYNTKEAAERIGRSVSYLKLMRKDGVVGGRTKGPKFARVECTSPGSKKKEWLYEYYEEDLDAWIAQQRAKATDANRG